MGEGYQREERVAGMPGKLSVLRLLPAILPNYPNKSDEEKNNSEDGKHSGERRAVTNHSER